MSSAPDLCETIFSAWRTNNRVTLFLFEHLPADLWAGTVPGAPRRTIRMIAGHIHSGLWQWTQRAAEAAAPRAS